MRLRLLFAVLACGLTAWIVDAADIPLPRAVFPRSPAPRERRIDPIPAPRPARVIAAAPVPRNFDMPVPRHVIAPFIDHHIDAALAEAGVTPAAQADDATLIRRLTLDLVGRIPTTSEVDAYLHSSDSDKRAILVDRLMTSPTFARHQAALFEVMFSTEGNRRGGTALRDYLTNAVREGKPWDRVFREMLLPDETDAKLKGAAEFIRGRVADADKLTNDTSVSFFGVNVSCAQCHNHPNVADWTQDHFYGMKMFLARTFDNGGFLGERGSGTIKYKPTKGPERTAKMMFLTGTVVEDGSGKEPSAEAMRKEKSAIERAKSAKTPPPAPKFSARTRLVEIALADGNAEYFAKNIVNRIWHRYFGSGLVNPLDQLHSANPSSHPELLNELARDFAAGGYNLRWLTRGIVMSRAYSRSSKYHSNPPEGNLFAVAKLKPLTPLQLATSLKIAATDPAELEGKDLERKLEQLESSARGLASLLAQPTDNFQIGVGEALLFSNSERIIKEYLTDGSGSSLGRACSMNDPKRAVEFLVQSAYGRAANPEELRALSEYVEKRRGREAEAYRQVLWALVTAPEFRFSY